MPSPACHPLSGPEGEPCRVDDTHQRRGAGVEGRGSARELGNESGLHFSPFYRTFAGMRGFDTCARMVPHASTTDARADPAAVCKRRATAWRRDIAIQSKIVKIELTSDAALVLYDWLTRFNQREEIDVADQAEERVLFDLEAMLEKALATPLQSDYAELLAQARSHVRDEGS
jgi:hypothetical protein